MKKHTSNRPRREIVTLDDLAPRHDVTGGAARRVFGAEPLKTTKPRSRATDGSAKTAKDGKDGWSRR